MEDLGMKLENVKSKIDGYLDNISADELLERLTGRYGMSEYDLNNIEDEPDDRLVGNAKIA